MLILYTNPTFLLTVCISIRHTLHGGPNFIDYKITNILIQFIIWRGIHLNVY